MTKFEGPWTVAGVHLSVRWCLLAGLACLSPAVAQESDLLRWDAPPACGSRAQLWQRIETLSGMSLATLGDDTHILVSARPVAGAWQVELQIRRFGETRVRTVQNASCQLAMDAVALVVALLLDPEGSDRDASASPDTAEESRPVAVEPAPDPDAGWQALVGAALGLGTALPQPGPGLRLRGGLHRHGTSVELRVMSWGRQAVQVLEPAGATAEILEGAAALVACHLVAEPWLGELSGCLGPMVTYGHGRARGVSDPGQASGVWWGANLELALTFPLGGFLHFRLAPGVDISVKPPFFTIEGIGRVYRAPPVVPYITIGPELRF